MGRLWDRPDGYRTVIGRVGRLKLLTIVFYGTVNILWDGYGTDIYFMGRLWDGYVRGRIAIGPFFRFDIILWDGYGTVGRIFSYVTSII